MSHKRPVSTGRVGERTSPFFPYNILGSAGLYPAPGSSPGTRRKEDQPKGWSSFYTVHRAEAATENAPGMREHSALVIPAPELESPFYPKFFNFGHFYVKNTP